MSTRDTGGHGLLRGRVAFVTGAVGAIGNAVAHCLAREGADVVVADLDQAAAAAAAHGIAEQNGVRALGVAVDVADPTGLESVADRIEAELGVCDIIIANAGILVAKPALEISKIEWDRVMSVNLSGAFHTATVFGRRMVAAERSGSIAFASSLFGVRGGPGNGAYSASKFGVIGLAQSMAAELAPFGIRVNSVCPGQIASAMIEDLFQKRAESSGLTVEEERAAFEARIPLGRLGTPDDVANTFLYLASDLSSYVTGQHIIVDGGWQVA